MAERLLPGLTSLLLYNIGREGLTTMAVYSSPLLLLYYCCTTCIDSRDYCCVQHRQRGYINLPVKRNKCILYVSS
jgi:hypothetical protein